MAKKYTDQRTKPRTQQRAFELTAELADKIQEVESFEHNSTGHLPVDVNKIFL